MREEPERVVHEVVVLVIAAIHRARALAGFPERILFGSHRAEFGEDLLAGKTNLGEISVDLETVCVGVAHEG